MHFLYLGLVLLFGSTFALPYNSNNPSLDRRGNSISSADALDDSFREAYHANMGARHAHKKAAKEPGNPKPGYHEEEAQKRLTEALEYDLRPSNPEVTTKLKKADAQGSREEALESHVKALPKSMSEQERRRIAEDDLKFRMDTPNSSWEGHGQ